MKFARKLIHGGQYTLAMNLKALHQKWNVLGHWKKERKKEYEPEGPTSEVKCVGALEERKKERKKETKKLGEN